jgi:glycosyltransferase involved in cell wall biosynthesis
MLGNISTREIPISEPIGDRKERIENAPAIEVSVIMPCLNEAETLEVCIKKAQWFIAENDLAGEVIIADNGSDDGSQEIARRLNARVVNIPTKGYGSALKGGIEAARGKYIIMGDADDSYDFSNLNPFIKKLRNGYDLVMGNRFKGGIESGAMPFLHRYLGNPVLTGIGKLLFASPCDDFHCGLRGFRKDAIANLDLQTTGMEFASEMVVKATLHKMQIAEVPTTLSKDGRSRPPHLNTWRDGWRHLRFLLMYSPRWLFFYPGIFLILGGFLATLSLLPSPKVHSLLYSSSAMTIGFQIVMFALFTKVFGISEGLLPEDRRLNRLFNYLNLETGLIAGCVLFLMGTAASVYAFGVWGQHDFGSLNPAETMPIVIPGVTCLALGIQTIFSSFFLSILGLKR